MFIQMSDLCIKF